MKCPTCDGECGWYEDYGLANFPSEWQYCPRCTGTGKISFWEWKWEWITNHIPERLWLWYVDWRWDRRYKNE